MGGYFLLVEDVSILFKCKIITDGLKDYKLWCFNGEPQVTLVCTNRFSENGLHEDFFDMEWNHLSLKRPYSPHAENSIGYPLNYRLMQQLARKVSKDIPFVRVDFYEINGRVYFGEITFFPATGMQKFEPVDWDYKLGELIDLSLSA